MADQDQGSKTEQPTGKRVSDAMERGQFAKVQELQMLFTMAAVLGVLAFAGQAMIERVAEFSISMFSHFPAMVVRQDTVPGLFADVLIAIGPVVLPVLLTSAGAAFFAGGLQTGFHLTPKVIEFDLGKLNPSAGFERMFSKDIFVRLGMDLLKCGAVGIAVYLGARKLLRDPLFSSPVEVAYLGRFMNQAATEFFSRLMASLAIIAALNYGYQKFKTTRELMMTRQEVQDEHKSTEVDSKIKGAQRRLARRLMQKQMLEAVPTADVIVTNPTHYAVALKYERGKDRAPVVLAKGENRFAQRLKALAAEHGVPTVENKPVARLLFGLGRVGETIPPQLYQAVAEILAVVYRTHRYYFHRLRSRRIETAA
jgi:flagellar biosynthetic protein FlhB